jgi:hypothetical protein
MSAIYFILALPLFASPFFYKFIKSVSFKFSPSYSYWIYTFSFTMNFFLLLLLICDFYLSVNNIEHHFFTSLWRLIYWINFTLGFFVFPLIYERERNSNGTSNIKLLLRFYLRRFLIILAITTPILILIFLLFKIQVKKLIDWKSVYLLPILVVTVWGCILILLHLSLVLISIPKATIRMLLPSAELSTIFIAFLYIQFSYENIFTLRLNNLKNILNIKLVKMFICKKNNSIFLSLRSSKANI